MGCTTCPEINPWHDTFMRIHKMVKFAQAAILLIWALAIGHNANAEGIADALEFVGTWESATGKKAIISFSGDTWKEYGNNVLSAQGTYRVTGKRFTRIVTHVSTANGRKPSGKLVPLDEWWVTNGKLYEAMGMPKEKFKIGSFSYRFENGNRTLILTDTDDGEESVYTRQ